MAGKKYAIIVFAKTPPTYAALPEAEKAKPGKAFEDTVRKYGGRIDPVRRYWTGAFTHEATDVFVIEADDPADLHAFNEDLEKASPPSAATRPASARRSTSALASTRTPAPDGSRGEGAEADA